MACVFTGRFFWCLVRTQATGGGVDFNLFPTTKPKGFGAVHLVQIR
ncbi:hypothetical protein [Flexibacter flexilis]|nr:hypothetical protein [Flexibacter flexilis]